MEGVDFGWTCRKLFRMRRVRHLPCCVAQRPMASLPFGPPLEHRIRETRMPTSPNPPTALRKKTHAGSQGRLGTAQRQQGLSRMALEQPDDTPLDQRLSHVQRGSRQMA
jgi:hypothetical protein